MYQNIINFLLGRNKKNLSKQETDDLIKLIAQSIGLEEEYKEKTDDKSFIKRMLDEVIIEENTAEEEFSGALDDIFDFEEDSYEYGEDYEELEESYDGGQPLSKRKISRKNVFKKTKIEETPVNDEKSCEEENKKESKEDSLIGDGNGIKVTENTIGNKETNTGAATPSFVFKLPESVGSFNLPKTKIEETEFKFDVGALEPVHKTGPHFKFLDEDGSEL